MNKMIDVFLRPRPKNKFLNTSGNDRKTYNEQNNLCVSLIESEKTNFFNNLNTNDITDTKTFWKTVEPIFH